MATWPLGLLPMGIEAEEEDLDMSKIKRGNSCFEETTRYQRLHEKPTNKVKRWIKNAKHVYQRAKYGFCEADIWEMDTWFLKTVPAMLEHLKESHLDYPQRIYEYMTVSEDYDSNGELAFQRWDEILSEIIRLFDEVYAYGEKVAATHPFLGDEEKEKQREDIKNKAFSLFSEWFFDLWC